VTFRTDSGVLGPVTVSEVSAGRKNRLWFEFDREHRCAVFDQENPTFWLGSQRPRQKSSTETSPTVRSTNDARRNCPLASQGYAQWFDNFIEDTYAAVRGEPREGLPTIDECHNGS
jgi:hypothetical protein